MDTYSKRRLFVFCCVIAACLLPSVLNLLGVYFDSTHIHDVFPFEKEKPFLLEDDMFKAMSGSLHHALLEWSAVAMALTAAFISIVHYYRHREVTVPIIGMAIFSAGIVDIFHTLASMRLISASAPNDNFIPFTWALSRMFNATLMILGIITSLWITHRTSKHASDFSLNSSRQEISRQEHKQPSHVLLLFCVAICFALLAFFSVQWAATSESLPQTTYKNVSISRPYDILPLALFLISISMIWSWYQTQRSLIKFTLMMSVITAIATQMHMAFGSTGLFDNHFNIAHALKVLSYGLILGGFTIDLCRSSAYYKYEQEIPNTPVAFKEYKHPEALPVGQASMPLLIKLPLLVFGLALLISSLVSMSFYFGSQQVVRSLITENLRVESESIENAIHSIYQDAASHLNLLSQNSYLTDLSEKSANTPLNSTRLHELTNAFKNMLHTHSRYLGIKLIRVKGYGEELISVNRKANRVVEIPRSRLMSKEERAFFINGLGMNLGDVTFSKVSLLLDRGVVSLPHKPVVQASTPIFNETTGEIFGLLVMTLDFFTMIEEIKKSAPSNIEIVIANEQGSYLYHKEQEWLFNPNAPETFNLYKEYTLLDLKPTTLDLEFVFDDRPAIYKKIHFNHIGYNSPFHFVLQHNIQQEFIKLSEFRNQSILLGITLALLAVALAILVLKRVSQNLSQMTKAVQLYEHSSRRLPLPIDSQDEVGVFARSFHNMLLQVESSLEQQALLMTAAKETAAHLEGVVSAAADGIITLNDQGLISSCNPKAQAIFGYTEDELLDQPFDLLVCESFTEKLAMPLSDILLSSSNPFLNQGSTLAGKHKKGKSFPVHLSLSSVLISEDKIYIAMLRDISQQIKEAEQKDQNLSILQATLDSTNCGILVINDKEEILISNRSFEKLWKISNRDLCLLNSSSLNSRMQNKLQTPKPTHFDLNQYDDFETPVILRFKDQHCFEALVFPIILDGKHWGRIWSFRDISAQQHYEENLVQSKINAEKLTIAKSEFLASMSHEIRTPMNGVIGMLNLLMKTPLQEDQYRKAHLAQSSALSLLSLINDILDFSKVEAGKLELEIIDFNLRKQIGDFAEAIALKAQEKGLEFILDLTGINESMVRSDASRLRQILTNLVANAIKFTHSGDITLTATLSALKPKFSEDQNLTLETEGDTHTLTPFDNTLYLLCTISDTGIGIPQEKLDNIFDSFQQASQSTSSQYGGTGLGLSIAKKLCQVMGGEIRVESQPGVGSTFEFYIQLQPSENSYEVKPSCQMDGQPILIVDDNKKQLAVLKKQLEHWDITADTASSGEKALEYCEQREKQHLKPYKGLLIDLHMPNMDGEQLANLLTSDSTRPKTKLIIMTTINDPGDSQYYKNRGFIDYFPKPITTSDLINALAVIYHDDQITGLSIPLITHNTLRNEKREIYQSNSSSDSSIAFSWPKDTRLLLVEDNHINQEVALGALEELGLQADVAASGLEAIKALDASFSEQPYTLILMDCLMPEMDGYETTQRIRHGECSSFYTSIPIIAMTANAMNGDEERCLESGMNDYLSKPVDIDTLEQTLMRWLKPDTAKSQSMNAHSQSDDNDSNAQSS